MEVLNLLHIFRLDLGVLAPAADDTDPVADLQRLLQRRTLLVSSLARRRTVRRRLGDEGDATDGTGAHRLADLDGRNVGTGGVEPACESKRSETGEAAKGKSRTYRAWPGRWRPTQS